MMTKNSDRNDIILKNGFSKQAISDAISPRKRGCGAGNTDLGWAGSTTVESFNPSVISHPLNMN